MKETEMTEMNLGALSLYGFCVRPEAELKGVVLILHGYAEHVGRYHSFASFLKEQGYAVLAFDWRGHGRSPGPRALVADVEQFMVDFDQMIAEARSLFPGKPLFLFGHSMGGGLTVSYLISRQPELSGVILSGAALIKGDDIADWQITLSRWLAKISPTLPLIKLDSNMISKDPAVIQAYDADPLVYRGGAPAQTAVSLMSMTADIAANMEKVTQPIFILFGTDDKLANPAGSQQLFERAAAQDKQLKRYEGFYHEIINEPGRDQVLADIIAWLDLHV